MTGQNPVFEQKRGRGRPRTRDAWEPLVRGYVANCRSVGDEPTARGAVRYIQNAPGHRDANPDRTSIRRVLNTVLKLKPEELREYEYVRWPQSFEQGVLPWEGARHVLDLLRWHQAHGQERPTIRGAKWFFRVSVAAHDAPFEYRQRLALELAANEASGGEKEGLLGASEYYLAFSPWLSPAADVLYRATSQGKFHAEPFRLIDEVLSPVIPSWETLSTETDTEDMSELLGPARAEILKSTPELRDMRERAQRAREQNPELAQIDDQLRELFQKRAKQLEEERVRGQQQWEEVYGR